MRIREVAEECQVGDVLYRYTFGVAKLKIVAIHKKTHSVLFEDSTGTPWLCYDYCDGYFHSSEEAVNHRKECIEEQIRKLQAELNSLKQ